MTRSSRELLQQVDESRERRQDMYIRAGGWPMPDTNDDIIVQQEETANGDVHGFVLDEANRLIHGDRQAQYGPPEENFKNIAKFWNIRFAHLLKDGAEFAPSDVAVAMVFLKLARDMQGFKLDTAVDGAGYLALMAYMKDIEENEDKK